MNLSMITPPPHQDVLEIVALALREDLGSGDISAQLIPDAIQARGRVISRDSAIFCGTVWANEVLQQVNQAIEVQWLKSDGDEIEVGDELAILSGPARDLLSAERCMLNFLQTLSATATLSHKLAKLVSHTKVKLLDTRKTLPGLRVAQKFAVAVGGCHNHRKGLYDGYLVKENHISACGSIPEAILRARALQPQLPVEVEVQNLAQLEIALQAGADIVMLDNFDLDTVKQAVAFNHGRAKLEASGGVDEENLVLLAETGVDLISIGALTKNCKAVDLSLLFE